MTQGPLRRADDVMLEKEPLQRLAADGVDPRQRWRPSQGVEHMRFREVVERQPGTFRISQLDHRFRPTAHAGSQRIGASSDPRTQRVFGNLKVAGSFKHAVQGYIEDLRSAIQLLKGPTLDDTHATILTRQPIRDN